MASTKECEGCAEVLGLTNYYRQFVKDFARIAKLLYEITRKDVKKLGRKTAEGIWRVAEVYNKASLSNTRLGQRNKSRSGYIGLCYRRSVVSKV